MRKIFFFIILLSPKTAFTQQDTVFIRHKNDTIENPLIYQTDTVIFASEMQRHILTGTTVLPATHNQMAAYGYGLWFNKVKKIDCVRDGRMEKGGQNKINNIIQTDTSLIVEMTIYDNCCYDFLCDIEVDSTDALHLIYHGYGTYCACNCCFGLTYYFSIIKNPEYKTIKGVMLNNQRYTFRQILKAKQ